MKMLINGRRTEASDGRTIDVINPANNAFVDTIPMASAVQRRAEGLEQNAAAGERMRF